MISMQMLNNGLESSIVRSIICKQKVDNLRGILLLKKETAVTPNYIYIGTADDCAYAIINGKYPQPVTFFSAGDSTALREANCSKVNIIVTEMDLFDLHNSVYLNYLQFAEWNSLVNRSINSTDGITALFSQVSEILGSYFALLDPGFRVITQNINKTSDSIEIISGGYISEINIRKYFPHLLAQESTTESFEIDGTFYCIYPIYANSHRLGFLLVESFVKGVKADELIGLLIPRLKKYLNDNYDNYAFRNVQFKVLFEDLMNSELRGLDEIGARMMRLPNPPQKYMRLLVIQFESTGVQIDKVIASLEIEFPKSSITSYKGDIIILFSDTFQLFSPVINIQNLEENLEEHSAFAVLGNSSTRMRGLYTHYSQCKSMLSLVNPLRKVKTQRYFEFEKYSLYYIIHLCAETIANHYGHDDLMYLVHPCVIILTKYDRTNNTGLRDFLFYYIMNNCNIAGTARQLYLHRNTAVYRLRRIAELTGTDLNNGTLRTRLALSCLVMRYIENYQHREIMLEVYTESDQYRDEMK